MAASDNRQRHCSIYEFFFELLPATREALDKRNDAKLAKLFAFAEWAAQHPNQDIWNAAGVAFYEHIFDDDIDLQSTMSWISPRTRRDVTGLWELMLPPERFSVVLNAVEQVRWAHQRECESALADALQNNGLN